MSDATRPADPADALARTVFPGSGEMPDRCRRLDWSATPLGPVGSWPESLRAAAGLVLAHPAPMMALWGPDLIQIYNDAYRDVLGDKHPSGLGQPTRECWPEVWEFNGSIYEAVLERGEPFAFRDQRLVIERHGYPEEAFFELTYSALPDAGGRPGGVLVSMSETTAQVRARAAERKAMAAVRESEERYRALAELSPDATMIIAGTRIVYANPAVVRLLGARDASDLVGLKAIEIVEPEYRDIVRERMRRALEDRLPNPLIEERFRRLDGTTVDVEVAAAPITWAGTAAIQVVARDISERKRADAERTALQARLSSDLEAMTRLHELSTRLVRTTDLPETLGEILDATIALHGADFGAIQLYDPRTETLSIVVQRGLSQPILDHFRVVDAADGSACGRALRQRERIIVEDVEADAGFESDRAVTAGAGIRAVQSTPIFARDGEPQGMLSTHFRRPHRPSERDLRLTDLYMRIAAELIARARDEQALRKAKQAAEQASRAKSEFLAFLSHELRTPLTNIVGNADLLEADALGSTTAKQRAALGRIRASAWFLVDIIEDILTFARAEAGRLEVSYDRIDLAAVARDVVRSVRPQADAKGLTLDGDGLDHELRVRTDSGKVRQILFNLLTNAVKFTRSGGVTVALDRSAPEQVRIHVRDTGPGIAPGDHERIFEPFTQAGERLPGVGGTGLGLAISRRLARRIGGDVALDSAPGEGSTFTLRLPLEPDG